MQLAIDNGREWEGQKGVLVVTNTQSQFFLKLKCRAGRMQMLVAAATGNAFLPMAVSA